MKNPPLIIIITSIVALTAISVFSASKSLNKTLSSLESGSNLEKIERQLESLTSKIDAVNTSVDTLEKESNLLKEKFIASDSADYYINSINKNIEKLKGMIAASGLQNLGTNMLLDSAILSELAMNKATEKKVRVYSTKIRAERTTQKESDQQSYGTELAELLTTSSQRVNRGRGNREGRAQRGERAEATAEEKALKEQTKLASDKILSDYPYSYAAGEILFNQAVQAIRKNKLDEAQKYYDLIQNNNLSDTITRFNQRAGVSLESQLASAYIKAGDSAKAYNMIYQLEANTDDLVSSGGRNRGLKSTQALGQELKDKLEK